MHPPEAKLLSP